MPKPISITLRTLTPIWAGGVESGRTKRVHETGIIGSLRWWYEAILRGIGREVCNPTSDNPRERCPRNDGFYCDVCRLFGATGRSRGFRLRIGGGTSNFSSMDKIPLPSGRLHPGRKGRPGPDRPGGWFLFADARTGNLEIRIVPLFVTYEDIATLLVPLALIYRHAALGAKVANGYGVVDITGVNNEAFVISDAMLRRLPTGENAPDTLPNLRDFFFAKVRFQAPVGDPDWWQAIPGIAEAWKGMLEKNGKRVGVFDQYDRKKNDRLCKRAQGELAALRQKGLLPMAPAVRKWLRETWFPSFSGHLPLNSLETGCSAPPAQKTRLQRSTSRMRTDLSAGSGSSVFGAGCRRSFRTDFGSLFLANNSCTVSRKALKIHPHGLSCSAPLHPLAAWGNGTAFPTTRPTGSPISGPYWISRRVENHETRPLCMLPVHQP